MLGWSATNNSIRIFYHQGECVIVHTKDWEADDMSEVSARLKSVSPGAVSQEFSLRRNQLGQLGFHVQHDGLITGEWRRVRRRNYNDRVQRWRTLGTPGRLG